MGEIKIGNRVTYTAHSPIRRGTKEDRESKTSEYVSDSQIGQYRRSANQVITEFDEFIRNKAHLGILDSIIVEQNTTENPFNLISINSDSDFCDRKEAYKEIPGFFGRLAICCSAATRRENMSVLFLGNILGRTAAKRKKTRKLYYRIDGDVRVTELPNEDQDNEKIHYPIPEEIKGISEAVEMATIGMQKKGSKVEVQVQDEDGNLTTIKKDADPKNQTLVINVGIFSVRNEMGAEENNAVRMCVITCNGVYSEESAMQVMTELKDNINKVEGCEEMGVFIVPMEKTPKMVSQGTRYVHCETLFANMVRDAISNSSREMETREAKLSIERMLNMNYSDNTSNASEGGTNIRKGMDNKNHESSEFSKENKNNASDLGEMCVDLEPPDLSRLVVQLPKLPNGLKNVKNLEQQEQTNPNPNPGKQIEKGL